MERNDSTPSRVVWIWGAGLVFVVVIAAVAFFTSRPADTPTATDAAVTTSGAALPGFSPDVALNDPAVGLPAPAVTGLSFNGDTVSVSPGDGTPKVLILLAHWCGICQREVPSLVQWSESGGDLDGVEVIAVATAIDRTRGNWPPGAWLQGERWPFPTIVDDDTSAAGAAYGVTGFPHFVAIDADGNVVARTSGNIGVAGFEKLLDAARTGQPTVVTPEGVVLPGAPQPS